MKQVTPLTDLSRVVESQPQEKSAEEILEFWTEERMRSAVPEPSIGPAGEKYHIRRSDLSAGPQVNPLTFVVPHIGFLPYSAICKVYYTRAGIPYVASAWIVHGNTDVKGIITSGHVVYDAVNRHWSSNYLVCRRYSNGAYAEQWTSTYARTLQGWMNGGGTDWFWDIGAIMPTVPVPATTPSLPATWNYNYLAAPFNYYYDVGYPARPANGYPFDGELQWESDGSLITAHTYGNQIVLEAYNAMEHGSSGSPWLIYDLSSGLHYAAGIQSTGWNGTPASYSPYFCQRNIVSLLIDINVWR